jgi:CheY-like chemotaxis protein
MRVLVVDDAPDIRMLAEMALATVGGMTVSVASGGQEGLDQLAAAPYDVVLLDVMMPHLDGPATLQRLRERGDDTPVVFFTARVRPDDVQSYLDAGAIGTIEKPFDPMTLADQVRRLLER